MNPLQVITFMVATEKGRALALSALPDAPRVPYVSSKARTTPIVRARLAKLLRHTADRIDPCPAASAG